MPRAATTSIIAISGRLALVAGLLACGVGRPAEAAERRPVAAVTIYPGDLIRDPMITEADFPDAVASSAYVANRMAVVGKVARRTLLPGQAIPSNAVGEPKLVTIGAMVRVVYKEDGLTIATYASALQAGAAGDVVSARNVESGVIVSGVIQADGSIHIGAS